MGISFRPLLIIVLSFCWLYISTIQENVRIDDMASWETRADIFRRHEYKHSFCTPKLIIGNDAKIPFWRYGGDAIASQDSLRLVPSIRSRRGWIWNEYSFDSLNWQADIAIRVSGRLRQGADGMAVWFTSAPTNPGSTFGSAETWNGLGVFLDSFDNDGMKDNPKIQLVLNGDDFVYEHHTDGKEHEKGNCVRDFRNQPYPVRMKIIKMDNFLQIWLHHGYKQHPDPEDYDLCVQTEDIAQLPSEGYFGMSAATGGLSDDHDVTCFIVHSLKLSESPPEYAETNRSQLSEEYEKFNDEFSERVTDFRKLHPDKVDSTEYDIDDFEMNVISKLDELIAQQNSIRNNILSRIDPGSRIQPDSISTLLQSLSRDVKNLEHRVKDTSSDSPKEVITSQSLGTVFEVKRNVEDLKSTVDSLKSHIIDLTGKLLANNQEEKYPDSSNITTEVICTCVNCVGFWGMVWFTGVQTSIVICVMMFMKFKRRSQEKKFF